MSHTLNSGIGTGDSWNWGGGANYQQQPVQYGQPFQPNTEQYSAPYRYNSDVLVVDSELQSHCYERREFILKHMKSCPQFLRIFSWMEDIVGTFCAWYYWSVKVCHSLKSGTFVLTARFYIELSVPCIVCPIRMVSRGNALAKHMLRLMSVLLLTHVESILLPRVLPTF